MGFDFSLPFFDHGALFVAGKLHTVKVSETSVSLDLFAHKAIKNDHSKLLKPVSVKKAFNLKKGLENRYKIIRIKVSIFTYEKIFVENFRAQRL